MSEGIKPTPTPTFTQSVIITPRIANELDLAVNNPLQALAARGNVPNALEIGERIDRDYFKSVLFEMDRGSHTYMLLNCSYSEEGTLSLVKIEDTNEDNILNAGDTYTLVDSEYNPLTSGSQAEAEALALASLSDMAENSAPRKPRDVPRPALTDEQSQTLQSFMLLRQQLLPTPSSEEPYLYFDRQQRDITPDETQTESYQGSPHEFLPEGGPTLLD